MKQLVESLLQYIPKLLSGDKVWTLCENDVLTYFLSSTRQPHSVHQLKGETLQKEESNIWGNRLTRYV